MNTSIVLSGTSGVLLLIYFVLGEGVSNSDETCVDLTDRRDSGNGVVVR